MNALKNHNKDFGSDDVSLIDPPCLKWWHYVAYGSLMFILIYVSNVELVLASENLYVAPPAWLGQEYVAMAEADAALAEETAKAEVEPDFYMRTFTISAYYSPIQGQAKYATGSYAGDIRLNGSGVNGADGTPVYPGMIAAPSTYAFGTKMYIPGIGTVAVHDRGGAIKGNRLDVWMGYGDKGLQRALTWGKRSVDAKVYGVNPDIKEYVELPDYSEEERISSPFPADNGGDSGGSVTTNLASTPTPAPQIQLFSRQLNIGSSGNDVAELQQMLIDLNYYEGDVSSVFDEDTHVAVSKLQVDENIISSENSFGAGYVGPLTSRVLASLVSDTETAHAKSDTVDSVETFLSDLEIGSVGEDVRRLQEELRRFHLLGIDSTGYYGEVTEHAVFKFQQVNRFAGEKTSPGAGIFGPITRGRMNEIIAARLKTEELMEANE